ncbi:response regulator [Flavitalea sp. BT771]|uniref:response regulator n=1 Tax=Flavitalea sp. BT771 TaxID=3063329 RepID=UPI0026E17D4A|nr:response regulator [Flavitalea sp. BT771]MDO6430155.1 response regulator [Flavitalea sp. BT771]MDV6219706.1 response regulator [Flavitalea sp. BT771]
MQHKLNCILLIDDDEPTNFLNRITLEQADCAHTVQTVQSGQEALDFLMHQGKYEQAPHCPHPELIFLDINMPAMDGWEFLEKYRQLPPAQKASIVMIMLTTSLNPDDQLRAGTIPEIDGFEHKPLRIDRLMEVLKNYFPERL